MTKEELERKIAAQVDRCTEEISRNPSMSRENGMHQALSTALLAMATLKSAN